jgi:hypothetical protein
VSGSTFLFIDDERTLVDLNNQMLEAIGYKVVAKMDPIDKKPIKKDIFAEPVCILSEKNKERR